MVNSQRRGLVLVLMAGLMLSTVPVAVKFGLEAGVAPSKLLAPRMLVACLLLWLYVGITRPHRLRIDRRGLRDCALAGSLNSISLLLFYLALERLDAGVTIVIFSVYPAMLLGMLTLRGERITRLDWTRLVLAVGGVTLVAEVGGRLDPLGLLFVLTCAAVYTLYVFVVHTRLITYPSSTTAVWIVTFFALGVVLLRGLDAAAYSLSPTAWAVVLWAGVLGTAVARVAALEGIKLLGGGQVALLMPAQTVLSVIWAALLLAERMSPLQIGGALLVIGSIVLAPRGPARAGGLRGPQRPYTR